MVARKFPSTNRSIREERIAWSVQRRVRTITALSRSNASSIKHLPKYATNRDIELLLDNQPLNQRLNPIHYWYINVWEFDFHCFFGKSITSSHYNDIIKIKQWENNRNIKNCLKNIDMMCQKWCKNRFQICWK